MPFIVVWGIPTDEDSTTLDVLEYDIAQAVAGIPELENTANQVTVRYPAEIRASSIPREIVFTVRLFDKEKRTPEAKARLDAAVGEVIKKLFPEAELIEGWCEPIDPVRDGYWSS